MSIRPAPNRWADAAAVAGIKAGATSFVLLSGFRAISDDDFARVVLAERFAQSPALDPTGSSWLPFPFYVYGGALAAFGSSLEVARTVAGVLGVLSALLVWGAARVAGMTPRAALIGGAIAAALPSAAYLGAATVPEAPTAALCVFAAACLGCSAKLRVAGAFALFVACGSRYEAWGVAGIYALLSFWDAARQRDRRLAVCGALALAFPLLWLIHGVVRHGDPTFFVARVAAYRSALGPDGGFFERLLRTPLGFVTGEPELSLLLSVFGLPLALSLRTDADLRSGRRFALSLSALVLVLVLADLRGSAPTHHANRSLLAAWLGSALLVGHALERQLASRSPTRVRNLALLALLATGFGITVRFTRAPEPFADRRQEEDIGVRARERQATPLAIDAEDFGYLAIQAALGAPERTFVLDERDPRKPRAPDRLRSAPDELADELGSRNVRWLATPRARAALTQGFGTVRDGNAGWALVELR